MDVDLSLDKDYNAIKVTTKEFDMQMTIRMPDEYKSRIEEVSGKTGLRKSDIARMAIKKFLEDFEVQSRGERASGKAQDLIGVVSSGIPDLGTNHRQHLISLMRDQKR